ncbi:YIR protein [Plasmodium yoelii]|uniref:YIR protein n=1 Tax=Plasmodium yoelii TaxID=5861 RepID=A0A077X7J4_PLAYE|nr:YIR protein [Plasmodium yoelii]
MDKTLCEQFDKLRNYIPDELKTSTSNDIHELGNAKNYCPNQGSGGTECKTDFDKIKAGCLWLFEQLFVKSSNSNINNVGYIIIWLSYKLNQKTYDEIKNLNDFYKKCIENNTHYTNCKQGDQDCSTSLNSNTGYPNYKKIIDARKGLLNINIKNMSKFYDAFKLLCNMYTKFYANKNNKEYLNCAKKFVEKYKELNDDSDNTKDEAYCQVLSTLSNDYNNFKSSCADSDYCNNIPSLTSTETEEIVMKSSGNICDDTPSFSICSLFVLRKRAKKQYLREQLKNIKKRMDH